MEDAQHSFYKVNNVFESGLRNQLASREAPFHFDIKSDSVRFVYLFYCIRIRSPILYHRFLL